MNIYYYFHDDVTWDMPIKNIIYGKFVEKSLYINPFYKTNDKSAFIKL